MNFKIKKVIPINKKLYENISNENFRIEFNCPESSEKKEIDVFNGYGYLEDLVNENKLLKEDIIKNGIATVTNKHNNYLGLFSVYNNLSANYKLISCQKNKYLIVFDFGEVQVGRNILYVSGIWEIE